MDKQGLSCAQEKAAAARLLPLIRFPLMRPTMLINYWHAFPWFRYATCSQTEVIASPPPTHQSFDLIVCRGSNGAQDVLMRALLHAAEPAVAKSCAAGGVLSSRYIKRAAPGGVAPLASLDFVSEVRLWMPCNANDPSGCKSVAWNFK